MNNSILVNITLVISFTMSILFFLFPEYDIAVSEYFFDHDSGFIGKNNQIYNFIFYSVPFITKCLAYIFAIFPIIALVKNWPIRPSVFLKEYVASKSFYLLIVLILGPGLIVNYALKENFGRARPHQVEEFSGDKHFSRAFVVSDQCESNCSFSSGHAAMAFYFTAFAFVIRTALSNTVFIAGIVFGSLVGYVRIIMGGHFISDVVFSAFIVVLVNYLVFLRWDKFRKGQK